MWECLPCEFSAGEIALVLLPSSLCAFRAEPHISEEALLHCLHRAPYPEELAAL